MSGERTDFFVSHAGADRAWAEWVAWQLADAGYTIELDVWDWPAGRNVVLAMSDALARCDRVMAVLSPAYFERARYSTEEWAAALVHMPGTGQGRLLPVRVESMPAKQMPAVLRPLIFCDLVGLDAAEARRVLLEAVAGPRRPDGEPVFPGRGTAGRLRMLGGAGPQLPGSVPRASNLPAWNPAETRPKDKREISDYDVFLCHNSKDKPQVMAIGERLRERGILPWLDIWEIRPGSRWQQELRRVIRSVKTVAVFIGPGGAGPWQELEVESLLGEFAKRGKPIIPVILEGRQGSPRLPAFLSVWHKVDMRNPSPDPFEQLVWGITGERSSNG